MSSVAPLATQAARQNASSIHKPMRSGSTGWSRSSASNRCISWKFERVFSVRFSLVSIRRVPTLMSLYIELGSARVLLQSDFPELTLATARALASDGVHVSETSQVEPGELPVTVVVRRSASRPPAWDVLPSH